MSSLMLKNYLSCVIPLRLTANAAGLVILGSALFSSSALATNQCEGAFLSISQRGSVDLPFAEWTASSQEQRIFSSGSIGLVKLYGSILFQNPDAAHSVLRRVLERNGIRNQSLEVMSQEKINPHSVQVPQLQVRFGTLPASSKFSEMSSRMQSASHDRSTESGSARNDLRIDSNTKAKDALRSRAVVSESGEIQRQIVDLSDLKEIRGSFSDSAAVVKAKGEEMLSLLKASSHTELGNIEHSLQQLRMNIEVKSGADIRLNEVRDALQKIQSDEVGMPFALLRMSASLMQVTPANSNLSTLQIRPSKRSQQSVVAAIIGYKRSSTGNQSEGKLNARHSDQIVLLSYLGNKAVIWDLPADESFFASLQQWAPLSQ